MKIIIIGCPGSGKSTFAKKLRDITKFPLYHLDMIWHKPDRTNISKEKFDEQLRKIMRQDNWIIDGNYNRTLEMRIKECDTIFFMDYPLDVCLSGVQERIGKKRDDIPWVEEQFDDEFKQFILDFKETNTPEIYRLLEKCAMHKNVIVFKTRKEAGDFLENIENNRQRIETIH